MSLVAINDVIHKLTAERDEARGLADKWRHHAGGERNLFPWEDEPVHSEPWGVKLHRMIVATPSVEFVTMKVNGGCVYIKTRCHHAHTEAVRTLVQKHVPVELGWSLEFSS